MNLVRLATWRDVALVLLAAQGIALGLLMAAALYYGVRGMQRLRQWTQPVLFQARLRVWRVQYETQRVSRAVVAPFVWAQSAAEGLRRSLQMLGWR